MWVAAGARASRRSSYVGSSNKLASVLLLSTPAWLPKLYALTISFDEFDPTRFEGGTDFSDRFLNDYLEMAGDTALSSVGGYQLEGIGIHLFERVEGDFFTILVDELELNW